MSQGPMSLKLLATPMEHLMIISLSLPEVHVAVHMLAWEESCMRRPCTAFRSIAVKARNKRVGLVVCYSKIEAASFAAAGQGQRVMADAQQEDIQAGSEVGRRSSTCPADLPIGVFDSGVGGLTVLRALRSRLPNEQFIYLGDTARLPYGTKSRDSVLRYSLQAASFSFVAESSTGDRVQHRVVGGGRRAPRTLCADSRHRCHRAGCGSAGARRRDPAISR